MHFLLDKISNLFSPYRVKVIIGTVAGKLHVSY